MQIVGKSNHNHMQEKTVASMVNNAIGNPTDITVDQPKASNSNNKMYLGLLLSALVGAKLNNILKPQ